MAKVAKNIAVIGAGYTGLVAGVRLAEAGHKITILERGDQIGGLASGFKVEGSSLERGYHHLFRTDKYIINMADELGIGDRLKWYDSSLSIYYGRKLYPFMTAFDLLRFAPLSFIGRLRLGLVAIYLKYTKNWQQLENVTAYEWMKKWVGKEVTKVIWEPLLIGKFDKYYDKVSMAWLWARVYTRANSRVKGELAEKLGYFEGGFQVFTDALAKKLDELNIKVRTEQEIAKIISLSNNKVQINFISSKPEIYNVCLVTTPSHIFAKLIESNRQAKPSYINKLKSIDYLGARLLIFSSNQDISEYYWHNINDVNLPFLVFINHTKLVGKDLYNNKNVYYIGVYLPHDHRFFNLDDRKLEKLWFDGLKQIFPNFKESEIREKHHFRFANAQHIVDVGYSKKIPLHETPLPNIYLANFSQVYPEDRGTNYAVRDGQRIADIIKANIEL
ncbi:hypothetical protein A3F65_00690 [Candidatus Saccharibacteria bacterium RIFCSPHIGHO2_12_FULL_47_16b]|nr:MAG: hypothetical protein A3F65_00690 [Candidatus Saccharibacteria bacterium RIFCSPHIGHO2_12_FULL_47_16b]OGL40177.1 MAG: hypothetical protein A3J32_01670 [Candidatus Saccharibacteria bacterium RIFCSPLOWO2_02_FULL_46_7]